MPSLSLRALLAMFFAVVEIAAAQSRPDVKTDDMKTGAEASSSTRKMFALRDSSANNWGLLPPGDDPQNRLGLPFAKHLAQDQEQFWTYPFRAPRDDAKYLLPFLAFGSALIASDSWMSKQVPNSPAR